MRRIAAGSRLLVTGATGLLGANFVATAVPRFTVFAASGRHRLSLPGITALQCDLRQTAALRAWVRSARPDAVVHLAAATNVDRCEIEAGENTLLNTEVPSALAHAAVECGARFVQMSTDAVFAGTAAPYREDDPTGPVNAYARAKLAAEHAVRAAAPDHLIVRASIYGWNAQPKLSLSEWVLRRLERGERVPGFVDVFFSPILVNTLATVILQLLEQGAIGTVHVGCCEGLSKYDFACRLATTFGYSADAVDRASVDHVNLVAPRPRDTRLACDRLQAEFGIVPPTIASELERCRRLRDDAFVARLKSSLT